MSGMTDETGGPWWHSLTTEQFEEIRAEGTRWIDEDGGTHWTDENGAECYSTFNLDDPDRKYTFRVFLDHLTWCDGHSDEGFPGPDRYTKQELIKLAQDAADLLDLGGEDNRP